ncbi:N-6 DNA Methylase [Actinobacteria bacterium IMCC26207]|nr:N-6 DNA Methylase [Actinobacteria bacterium IMCC26207]
MADITGEELRQVRSLDEVIKLLADELDWPIPEDGLEEATWDWESEELGIPADQVPKLNSFRQLPPLVTNQPWAVFFLEFKGPRLPLTTLRRLLDKLVTRKRQSGDGSRASWKLNDLLFIITTSSGESVELHFLAFFDQPGHNSEIRSIPWRPGQSPAQHLTRVATELLPHLSWPENSADSEEWGEQWRAAFKLRHGEAIRTVGKLVDRMASTAKQIRVSVEVALAAEEGRGPFTDLLNEVRTQLIGSVTPDSFADMCAQTLVYGTLTGRVTDPESFGASPTLSAVPLANPFLASFFESVHDHAAEFADDDGLEQLVADLKASEIEAVLDQFGSTARGGDPVIHLYEEFLHQYDPEAKIQAGAFYTPQAAVRFMVRMCDAVLKDRLGLPLGAADGTTWGEICERLGRQVPGAIDPGQPFVSMLDPATGTGTYLVEWIRQARASFLARNPASGWPDHARAVVLPHLRALELMLAPYAVAHLKTALELHGDGIDGAELGIYLTDTLQRGGAGQLSLQPDALSVEGERANEVKRNSLTTVCIGNPPYDRVAKGVGGGWITDASAGRSLFDDILDPAKANTMFSHQASLYNKFVYFWRWSLWKVFEDRPGLPGVVSLITPSSWLTGPGFMGLRELVRQLADDVWVVDLGGDNRGTRREENIFDIETPVAIVTICRSGAGDLSLPASVRYRRFSGTAEEKLNSLASSSADLDSSDWTEVSGGPHSPFTPSSGAAGWTEHPALIDLLPWQQPGCKFGRTWPIAPDSEVLTQRWDRFTDSDDPADRATCFVTPTSGRRVDTRVGGLKRLLDEPVGGSPPRIVRYGYRSFDRQWAFDDPRMAKTESPSLWAAMPPSQVFLVSKPTHPLGGGPAATVTTAVPDLHYFRGSFGGKDIIPLYRDAAGTPNVDPATLEAIGAVHTASDPSAMASSPEDLFSYCYAVLAGANYTERFVDELETPGPRVPLTADPQLFEEVAQFGRRLLWLHTFGERFADGVTGSVRHEDVRVVVPVTQIPATPKQVGYDADRQQLIVGDGRIGGVAPEVWEFEVSGMPVLKKWLGYRTAKGAGKATSSKSPLDHIRPTEWLEEWTEELLDLVSILRTTLELQPVGVDLLDRVCAGPLIAASDLPPVPPELRKPPEAPKAPRQAALGI